MPLPDPQPELVAHHFTQAGETELAIEWWGKAGDAALRRSAFQEAIAHLGKAIEMADREGAGASQSPSNERAQLHLGMATAMLQGRGMHAPETRAAFEQAGDIAAGTVDPMERVAILYGQWAGELAAGDARRMLEIAASMAPFAARESSGQGALVARRVLGLSQFFAGKLSEAATNMQWTVDHYDFDRDHGLAIRFAHDQGVAARYYLAFAEWMLGDVEAAFRLVGEAKRMAEQLGHPPTSVAAYGIPAWLDIVRGDLVRARANSETALAFARDFGLPLWRSLVEFVLGWTRAASEGTRTAWGDWEAILAASQGHGLGFSESMAGYIGAGYAALGDFDRALALVDRALGAPVERGQRVFLPEAHRVRGEILWKRDPRNPAPAEDALKTAIAIAREQGSRAFRLRAALSLAKLYRATGRAVEAHAVLSEALEGFAPTPEMPEIAEAQDLLAALAETEEVKAEAALRERRVKLQLGMATALLQSKGMQAPEARAAFDQAGDIAAAAVDPMERLRIIYGQWAGELARGDVRRMLEIASSMEPVAARELSGQGAIVARRVLSLSQYYAGNLVGADENMRWAIDHYDFDRDRALAVRFAHDPAVGARYYLACAKWMLGDIDAASRVVAEAKSLAERVDHPPTTVALYTVVAALDCIRDDHRRARANAEKALALARDANLALWRLLAEFSLSWATAASDGTRGDWEAAQASLASVWSTGTALLEGLGAYIAAGFADLREFDRALAIVDQALSRTAEKGVAVYLPEGHRVRGEILFKRDASDPEPAERSLQTAIGIAREQGARSYGLRAAISLAKLYQSTGRPVEAHAALSAALEGFPRSSVFLAGLDPGTGRRAGDKGFAENDEGARAPTSFHSPARGRDTGVSFEMPEIAEAQALMERLT